MLMFGANCFLCSLCSYTSCRKGYIKQQLAIKCAFSWIQLIFLISVPPAPVNT